MGSNYKTYNDSELLRLMAAENENALTELYERYWEPLFTKAFNFLGNEDAAKDCVQDVFIWLWQHRQTLDIENPEHYLRQAVRFQALRALREQKAANDFQHRLQKLTENFTKEDPIAYNELKTAIDRLLAGLPEDQQLIFRLHREQSLTYKQIAEELHISVKTVEKKMSLSLRYLRLHAGDLKNFILIYFLFP